MKDCKALRSCGDAMVMVAQSTHTCTGTELQHMPARVTEGSLPGHLEAARPWQESKQPVTSRHGSPPGMLKAAGVRVWASTALEGYTVKLIDSAWVKLWL